MKDILKDIWFKVSQSQWYGAVKPFLKMGINLALLFTLPMYGFLWWGIGGFFLGILLFCAIKVILMRKAFMYFIRETETKLFGKSLDKENWEKGEYQKPKIVWKSKKEEDK